MRIVYLIDYLEEVPKNFKTEFWATAYSEDQVLIKALRGMGHEVELLPLYDSIQPFLRLLEEWKPHCIFNLCEALHGDRNLEPYIAGLLEIMQVPYTGARPRSLEICSDKALSKKILHYNNIRIPEFQRIPFGTKIEPSLPYPAFVKPLNLEASEGISKESLVHNLEEAIDRIHFVHSRHKADAIIEEFIDGREFYVAVLGYKKIEVFPPRELSIKKQKKSDPLIYTHKAKWDEKYRKKMGIKTVFPRNLSPEIERNLKETAKKIYKEFQIESYARIDLRLSQNNEIVFLEANPNPNIYKGEDFAASAKKAGWSYEKLVEKILSGAH